MRFLFAIILLSVVAPFGAAQACEDLWFARNFIMDRAGYCFGSRLGQAVFDNSDCTSQQVRLDAADQATITQIRRKEAEFGCHIDTNQSWLNLKDINFRKVLTSNPIPDDFGWGCLGWIGPETPLYAGHQEPFHAIGRINPGDYVFFSHIGVFDWAYVTVSDPYSDAFKSAGWLYWPGKKSCTAEAG